MDTNITINGTEKMVPLISFHSIVDIDVGLIRLIQNEYLNPSVFDISFFNRSLLEIIKDLYKRKEENPLYLFAKNRTERIDEYYSDFLKEEMNNILDLSVSTDMENLLHLFKDSSEIIPTILCYDKYQFDILEKTDSLKEYDKILISDLGEKEKYSYTQYYFNIIEEAELFLNAKNKTFYFSSCGRNLNENNDDIKESDVIKTLVTNVNQINLFDLYRKDLLKKGNKNNGEENHT